jgi:hypothetical protein
MRARLTWLAVAREIVTKPRFRFSIHSLMTSESFSNNRKARVYTFGLRSLQQGSQARHSESRFAPIQMLATSWKTLLCMDLALLSRISTLQ